MKYEDFVNNICGDNWKDTKESTYGGYGMAIMLSYLTSNSYRIIDISKDINVPVPDLYVPYQNLLRNGILSKKFNAQNDMSLKGQGFSKSAIYYKGMWTKEQSYINSWCFVVAIASGLVERSF